MIHKYSNETQTLWNRGQLKVQLMVPTSDRPIGFCDGSDEDIAELEDIAEAEGTDGITIHRKYLKTDREIWTLSSEG
jgi:hypothetical protein